MTSFVSLILLCLWLSPFGGTLSSDLSNARLPASRYEARSLYASQFRRRDLSASGSLALRNSPSAAVELYGKRAISDGQPSQFSSRSLEKREQPVKGYINDHMSMTVNGHTYGIAEYGLKTKLRLYFYLHSYGNSRYEAAQMAPAAADYGVYLVAIDAPGIGGSSRQTFGRDWKTKLAADMDAIAQQKYETDKYGIICYSEGCPYALVIRSISPMVKRVVVLAGRGRGKVLHLLDMGLQEAIQSIAASSNTNIGDTVLNAQCMLKAVATKAQDLATSCLPEGVARSAVMSQIRSKSEDVHKLFEAESWRVGEMLLSKSVSFSQKPDGNRQWLETSLTLRFPYLNSRRGDPEYCPVDLYYGTEDRVIPLKVGGDLHRAIAGSRLYSGRWNHIEVPILSVKEMMKRIGVRQLDPDTAAVLRPDTGGY